MNTVKTAGEFIELVKSMRMYQKAFFEERNPSRSNRRKNTRRW
jgi:hypothetical protein